MADRKLSDTMRATLEALDGYDSGIDAGSTTGEIEASGGTRGTLYSAVKKGWVVRCSVAKTQGFYSTELGNVPRYRLTDEGKQILKEKDK